MLAALNVELTFVHFSAKKLLKWHLLILSHELMACWETKLSTQNSFSARYSSSRAMLVSQLSRDTSTPRCLRHRPSVCFSQLNELSRDRACWNAKLLNFSFGTCNCKITTIALIFASFDSHNSRFPNIAVRASRIRRSRQVFSTAALKSRRRTAEADS